MKKTYNTSVYALLAIFLCMALVKVQAQSYTENFDNIATLTGSGWAQQNLSNPLGTTNWNQGDIGVFPSYNGASNSYIFANFRNSIDPGNASNWLFTPTRTISNGDVISFYSRTVVYPTFNPDRLELRMSTNGASVNAGASASSVGDFTILLLSINPTLSTTGYPATWTQYSYTVSGLSSPLSGRFAFRYYVTGTGDPGNADYIGVDNVVYTSSPCATTYGTINASICQGSSYTFNGIAQTTAGTYNDTLVNIGGCDSILTLNLTVDALPTLVCAGAGVDSFFTDAGVCTKSGATLTLPTYTTACGFSTLTNNAPVALPMGSDTITWTVTDASGNTATCKQIVLVKDTTRPVITNCTANITISNDAGACGAVVNFATPMATDNCGASSDLVTMPSQTSTLVFDTRGYYFTAPSDFTITGLHVPNDASSDPQNVMVMVLPSVPAVYPGLSSYTSLLNWTGGFAGNGFIPVNIPVSAGQVIGILGTRGADVNSYSSTNNFITVNGTTIPITRLGTQNSIVSSPAPQGSFWTELGSSNISRVEFSYVGNQVSVTQTAGLPSGSTFPVGVSTVKFVAKDTSGNVSDTCSFTVTVNDTTKPTITCGGNITQANDSGVCGATVALSIPTTSDICGVDTVYNDAPSVFPIGATIVTWTVKDSSGNSATCTQTVTISDTTKPSITCPADLTLYTNAFNCGIFEYHFDTATATDNCGGVLVTSPQQDQDFAVGTHMITWIATDASGNVDSCHQQLTVLDTIAPTAICKAGTISLDTITTATELVSLINNSSTDNCNIFSYSAAPITFNCNNIGLNNITLTVTDTSGNIGTCVAVVTVLGSKITSSTAVLSNYNGSAISCFGASDGKAVVSATGIAPLSYLWSNGQITDTLVNVGAGTYYVSVTDGNGCVLVDSVTLINSNFLTVTHTLSVYNGYNVHCFGANDGTAIVTATGGTGTLSYTWSDAGIGNVPSNNALAAGTHTITVVDVNGCRSVDSFDLTQPTQIQTTMAATPMLCNGTNNGTATVTVNGGVGSYTYNWNTSPVQTSATATALGVGVFTVSVTDANNCTASNSIAIIQPSTLSVSGSVISNFNGYAIRCNGDSNGVVQINVAGGTSPYTYTWPTSTGVGNTASASTLSAGTYSVSVSDANGCSGSTSVTLNQPSVLSATASVSSNYNGAQISCATSTDGKVTAMGTGGVGGYNYTWNSTPLQTGATATNLGVGTYSVTISDASLCNATASSSISAPIAIVATSTVTSNYNGNSVSCFGSTNGSATIDVTGGTGMYSYTWPSSTGLGNVDTATNLAAGNYSITVADANGCQSTTAIILTQPSLLTAVGSAVDAKCFDSNTGMAWVTAQGGKAPYTYSWNTTPVQTNDTASNLAAGAYSVTVTDANGCTSISSVAIHQPTALILSVTALDVTCPGGNDGAATAVVNGATPSYTYSWNSSPVQTLATATGLTVGKYTVVVTDANGCSATDSVTLTVKYPTLPTSTISGGDTICAGDPLPNVQVIFTGTAPYSFTLHNGVSTQNYTGVTTSPFTISNAVQGTYWITNLSDAHCTGIAKDTVAVKVNPLPQVSLSGGGNVCDGDALPTIDINLSGTANWQVAMDWVNGSDTVLTVNTSTYEIQAANEGTYLVKSVIDGNGCQSININASASVGYYLLPLVDAGEMKTTDKGFAVQLDGKVINAYGGVNTISWTPDSSLDNGTIVEPHARPFTTTLYTIKATDKNGCSASDTVTVIVKDRVVVDMINVFTPDGDGINEKFVIKNLDAYPNMHLTIVNRWGQIVYDNPNYDNTWDGTWKGKAQDDGTYYYVIQLPGQQEAIKGPVTIIRKH